MGGTPSHIGYKESLPFDSAMTAKRGKQMNLGEAKKRVAMMTGNYSELGTEIAPSATRVKDFYMKLPSLFDMAQKQIATTAYIRKNLYISHLLPFTPEEWQLKTYTHKNNDITFSVPNAYAYCFKVDNDSQIIIEGIDEAGTVTILDEVKGYSLGGFTLFKDLIHLDKDYKQIQIRFTGDTYYNIKDIALYDVNFTSYASIPDFGAYIRYPMPRNFYKALKAEIKGGTAYEPLSDSAWEIIDYDNAITVSASISGEIRIEYAARTCEITSDTEDIYEFEISYEAQLAMLHLVASMVLEKDDYAQSQLQYAKYIERLSNIDADKGLQKRQRVVKAVYRV